MRSRSLQAKFFDVDVIENLMSGIPASRMDALIEGFSKDMRQRADRFSQEVKLSVLQSEAHDLQSVASSFGATSLLLQARELERLCRAEEADQARALVPALMIGIEMVLDTISIYAHRRSNSARAGSERSRS